MSTQNLDDPLGLIADDVEPLREDDFIQDYLPCVENGDAACECSEDEEVDAEEVDAEADAEDSSDHEDSGEDRARLSAKAKGKRPATPRKTSGSSFCKRAKMGVIASQWLRQ